MKTHLTTREVAEELGTDTWRVIRLFQSGRLAEPQRLAGKRAIPRRRIPAIRAALIERGWLGRVADKHAPVPAES